MKQPLPPHYYTLLEELQAIDFVLVELTLYLDTHPEDAQALEQFNQSAQQRQLLAQRYESEFGPLLQYGHSFSGYPWQWWEPPWPWQV
ncbi:spore coat protein CotJB [Paenibacillus elgii]|uniref:spore coat protein CotJB n=1 Tax=Paenibacillus elgii TaxID=189691 RepID=UPI002D7D0335|nr:spore coat protein CotJB [Paenibacillus elgii]